MFVSSCTAVAADRLPSDRGAPVDEPAPDGRAMPERLAASSSSGSADSPLSPLPPDSSLVPPFPAAEYDDTEGVTMVAHALTSSVTAFAEPGPGGEAIEEFANPTDRGGPLVFQALGPPEDGWIEVLLPVRPNGTTGWIHLDEVELTRNPYRIEIDLDAYHLTVWRENQVQISAPVAVGKGGTPTPIGAFYLVELLQPPQANGPYGAYAYGLSGYSDVLDNFNGGDGVIGIHGTNEPALLGGPASHGCIRLHNDVITEMAGFLPLGTPVSIADAGDTNPSTPDAF